MIDKYVKCDPACENLAEVIYCFLQKIILHNKNITCQR